LALEIYRKFLRFGYFEDNYYFQLLDQSKQCDHAVMLFGSSFRESSEGGVWGIWGKAKKGRSEKELMVKQDLSKIRPFWA